MPKKTTVPLLCSLCPGNPTFSDMSHLLTHISSKSHLAHRFKLEIRSQAEPEARERLDNYDLWYTDNNLEALLTERHAMKEEKKVAKERKELAKGKKTIRPNIKKEVKKEARVEREDLASSLASTPLFPRRGPQMILWPTATKSKALQLSSPTRMLQHSPKVSYETPTLRRPVPNFSLQETPHTASLSQQLRTPLQPSYKNDEDSEKSGPESAKLKGIYWPGMDLFDSATPEMKRMRNQRKDVSVLQNMMATSVGIQPLEVSYTPNGGFRSSRDIFGPLSDVEITPQKAAPTPKKRKSRKPGVLRDLNVNIPRLRTRNMPRLRAPEAQMTGSSPQKRQRTRKNASNKVSRAESTTANPLKSINNKFVPTAEESEEFRLTFGDLGNKRNFSIFQDQPPASPARSESPLEEFMASKFEQPTQDLLAYNTEFSPKDFITSAPIAKSAPYRLSGKENSEFEFQGRQASSVSATSGHILPSMVFNDPSSNPLYNQSLTNPFNFGIRQGGFDVDFKPAASSFSDYQSTGPFDGLNVPDYRSGHMNSGFGSSNNNFGNDVEGDYAYSGQYRL